MTMPLLRKLIPLSTTLVLCSLSLTAAPVAHPDSYSALEDFPLNVPAPGLLTNDDANGFPGGLAAVKVTNPAHGAVTVNSDGSFSYLSAANYNGPDSFTYKAVEAPPVLTFAVDRTRSVVNVKVTGTIPAGGTDSDNENANIIGTVTVLATPPSSPFATIHVQDFDVSLDSKVKLDLSWVFGLYSISAEIDPTRPTDPDSLRIQMDQAGPAVSVAPDGTFSQPGNLISATGRARLSGNTPGVTLPPQIDINSSNTPYDIAPVPGDASLGSPQISVVGPNLELKLPIKVTQTVEDPNYTVTIDVKGVIYATVAKPTLLESSPVTVSLTVDPTNDLPVAADDRYYTRQNHPLSLPATAVQTTENLITAGSVWKYNTGTDRATAWRTPDFADASWPTGTGVLGYGDADILAAGTIPARANMGAAASASNPNYPTAYFRRTFNLTDPFDTVQPTIEVQRDDACIVYVNGAEIFRDKDPYTAGGTPPFPASGEVAYATYSGAVIPNAQESVYKSVSFSRALQREGVNTVAVEVHQATNTSSDLRFELRASRTRGVAGLLANDSDLENDPLTAEMVVPPAHGTVNLLPNGSFGYTPALGYVGNDTFVYRLIESGFPATTSTLAIAKQSTWKYLEPTANLDGSNWRTPGYDDSAWLAASGPLGYGYGDIAAASTLTFGADPQNKPRTHYFRKKFTLPTAKALIAAMTVELRRDDGASVWINGQEAIRSNLPGTLGSTPPVNATLASSRVTSGPTEYLEFDVSPQLLVEGENTVAVEVHQGSADSSDLVFDMDLTLISFVGAQVTLVVQGDDADSDHVSDTWERQHNFNAANPADALLDTDGDGQNNRAEFLAGTDPRSQASVLRISTAQVQGPNIALDFPAVAGRRYRAQHSVNLQSWTDTGTPFDAASSGSQTLTTPLVPGSRFYRIRVDYDWQ